MSSNDNDDPRQLAAEEAQAMRLNPNDAAALLVLIDRISLSGKEAEPVAMLKAKLRHLRDARTVAPDGARPDLTVLDGMSGRGSTE